jgi:hypothetical protein
MKPSASDLQKTSVASRGGLRKRSPPLRYRPSLPQPPTVHHLLVPFCASHTVFRLRPRLLLHPSLSLRFALLFSRGVVLLRLPPVGLFHGPFRSTPAAISVPLTDRSLPTDPPRFADPGPPPGCPTFANQLVSGLRALHSILPPSTSTPLTGFQLACLRCV